MDEIVVHLKKKDQAKELIFLGKQLENSVTSVIFDFSEWVEEYGSGVIDALFLRPGDTSSYPVLLTIEGTKAILNVTDTELERAGVGSIELEYSVETNRLVRSETWSCMIVPSIASKAGDIPSGYDNWVNDLTELGQQTEANAARAEIALTMYPYIDPESKHWMLYDPSAGSFIDTGISAQGTPGISEDPRVDDILEMIPNEANPENQFADKNFVNSSIATNTANYIANDGEPFKSYEELEAYEGELTNNDYAFVVGTDDKGNTTYTRYKYSVDYAVWNEEYVLNNSSFTAEQWASIQSGITAGTVDDILAHMANGTVHVTANDKAFWNNKKPSDLIAVYGVTTFAEIYEAYSQNRRVILKYADSDGDIDVYELTEMQDSSYSAGSRRCYFTKCGHSYEIAYIRLKESDNSWSIGSRQIRSIPSTSGNVGKVLVALNENNEYVWADMPLSAEGVTF